MITSTSSAQVKHVLQLQKKAKVRREFKEFVVEGHKMVAEAPLDRVVKVYASETFFEHNSDFMRTLKDKSIDIETVSDSIFEKMSDTQTPQGILAVVKMADITIEDIVESGQTPLLFLLENLQDPGNLGTIIRMGEGAAATGVIMSSNTVDVYNPKTIRSTMGSIYRVKFAYAKDFAAVLKLCKEKGIKLFAAHLDGENAYNKDFKGPTAFLIGNEGNGLTEETGRNADELIKIPMAGKVESLNAAIACTILAFEAVRQRIVR